MKLTFTQTIGVLASEGDAPSRTIQGVAVPYGVDADASTGPVRFLPGSLPTAGPAPKLIMHHNHAEPVGIVTERVATDDGMMFSARISETAAGNEALTLAKDGVLDAVSVGVEPVDYEYEGRTLVVRSGRWLELSLVTFPAFSDARITRVAAEGDPDPDDDDTETPEIETPETPESEAAMTEAATVPTNPVAASLPVAYTRPRVTAGEWLSAVITGKTPPAIQAADTFLADVPGLLPEPLLGDVWTTQNTQRPLVSALGTRAMPGGGEMFIRRYISQHTDVDVQGGEGVALASQTYIVDKQTVTKTLVGGSVSVSAQSESWSEPSLITLLVQDMVRQYARRTEGIVCQTVANAATNANDTVTTWTDADDVIAALYNGAAEMFNAVGVMPTHMLIDPTTWAELGQSQTAGGAYGFPYLSPSNAAGQAGGGAVAMSLNPLGLSLVASPGFATAGLIGTQAYLLYAPAIEVYEGQSTQVRVDNPANATATLGVWNTFASMVMQTAVAPAPTISPYVLSLT